MFLYLTTLPSLLNCTFLASLDNKGNFVIPDTGPCGPKIPHPLRQDYGLEYFPFGNSIFSAPARASGSMRELTRQSRSPDFCSQSTGCHPPIYGSGCFSDIFLSIRQ
jgi:hypothetical protein